MTGVVSWFSASKGFGFITRDDGQGDIFTHWTAIQAEGYKQLEKDQRVEFEIVDGPKGKPQADAVKVIGG